MPPPAERILYLLAKRRITERPAQKVILYSDPVFSLVDDYRYGIDKPRIENLGFFVNSVLHCAHEAVFREGCFRSIFLRCV
jgi:hypothetical protein